MENFTQISSSSQFSQCAQPTRRFSAKSGHHEIPSNSTANSFAKHSRFCKATPTTSAWLTSMTVLALNLVFITATSALPGSRLYYTVFREDGDRMMPLSRVPSFAEPMPGPIFYSGNSQEIAVPRSAMGRRSQHHQFQQPLSSLVLPEGSARLNNGGGIPNKRHFVVTNNEDGNVAGRQDIQERGLLIGKKYDRNCFFSPVQCMLSFNKSPSDDPAWNSI